MKMIKAYGISGQCIKANMTIPYMGFEISVSNILKPCNVGVYFPEEPDLYFNTFDEAISYIQNSDKRVKLLTD